MFTVGEFINARFYKILQIGIYEKQMGEKNTLFIHLFRPYLSCSQYMTNPSLLQTEMPNLNLKPHNTLAGWQLGLHCI